MLSKLEISHKEFENLMGDEHLTEIQTNVNRQVEFTQNHNGMHQADPIFDEVPTAILKMKTFIKEFKQRSENHKREIIKKQASQHISPIEVHNDHFDKEFGPAKSFINMLIKENKAIVRQNLIQCQDRGIIKDN